MGGNCCVQHCISRDCNVWTKCCKTSRGEKQCGLALKASLNACTAEDNFGEADTILSWSYNKSNETKLQLPEFKAYLLVFVIKCYWENKPLNSVCIIQHCTCKSFFNFKTFNLLENSIEACRKCLGNSQWASIVENI